MRYNGQTQSSPECIPVSVNKLWGNSTTGELYAVGNNGLIAHYDGARWERVESGTELDVRDIWGAIDNKVGKEQILAIACNDGVNKKFIRIQGTTVTSLPDSGLSNFVYSIWFIPNRKYYVVGAGIHYKHFLDDPVWNRYPPGIVTSYESAGVSGNNINDVFVSGSYLEIVHFNGVSWYNYRNEISQRYAAVGVTMRNNLVIMAGLEGQKAITIVGRRN